MTNPPPKPSDMPDEIYLEGFIRSNTFNDGEIVGNIFKEKCDQEDFDGNPIEPTRYIRADLSPAPAQELEKLHRCAYTFGTHFAEGDKTGEYNNALLLLNEVIKTLENTRLNVGAGVDSREEFEKWAAIKFQHMNSADFAMGKEMLFDVWQAAKLYAAGQGAKGGAWRPIESAPKDGTKVDLWIAADYNHRLTDCQYFRYGQDGEGWYRNHGENKVNPLIITHWQPLPAAPTQERELNQFGTQLYVE